MLVATLQLEIFRSELISHSMHMSLHIELEDITDDLADLFEGDGLLDDIDSSLGRGRWRVGGVLAAMVATH